MKLDMDSYSWWSSGSKYISRSEMNKIKKKMLKSFRLADKLTKKGKEIKKQESSEAEDILKNLEKI